MEYSKKDWKLYRERIGVWQNAYMQKLVQSYIDYLTSDVSAYDKFWELEKRIKSDKKHPGVIIELRKSYLGFDLMRLIRMDVISVDDLNGFSDELIEEVKYLLEDFKYE